MCHHVETVDHERVMELAAEWERYQRERADEEAGEAEESEAEWVPAPADD